MAYEWSEEIAALAQAARDAGITPEEPFALNLESADGPKARAVEAAMNARLPGIKAVPLFNELGAPNRSRFTRLVFEDVEAELVEPAAYDVAYGLAAEFDLVSAEPDMPSHFYIEPGEGEGAGQDVESAVVKIFCEVDGEPPADKHWAPSMIKAQEAINYAVIHNAAGVGGQGILVAQPDTGVVLPNLDLEPGAIQPGIGWSIIENRAGAIDPLTYAGNPGHGTATGSVVISRPQGVILGAAPSAVLYPIRCIKAVTVFTAAPVAQAIEKAIEAGANVITMSLGGVPSRAIRTAIRAACAKGIIVLAAAGNCVRVVVWPARYPETIAVAGCNVHGKPWKGSCRGGAVDITAPAEQVWVASAKDPRGYTDGQGTSFAVALVAGAAAQWLAFHGRTQVLAAAAVRNVTVQELFRTAVQETASPAPALDKKDFGPGIVDIEALLKKPLNAIGAVKTMAADPKDDPAGAPPGEYLELLRAFGPDAEAAHIDWLRYGAEVGQVALKRAVSAKAVGVEIEQSAQAPATEAIKAAAEASGSRALANLLGA